MNELQQSLSKCRVEGNVVYLPEEHLHNYKDVKNALEKATGKYKRNTFVFTTPAQPFMDRLLGGESVNIQKEFQFFETPDELAQRMIELLSPEHGDIVLEPSAGRGALIKALRNHTDEDLFISYCELMPENVTLLERDVDAKFIGADFLDLSKEEKFHKIIANPPFAKNQDVMHILKMYEHLYPNGTLVSIASTGWMWSSRGPGQKFRLWLDDNNELNPDAWEDLSRSPDHQASFDRVNGDTVHVIIVEEGTFKQSGTNIKTCIIAITRK